MINLLVANKKTSNSNKFFSLYYDLKINILQNSQGKNLKLMCLEQNKIFFCEPGKGDGGHNLKKMIQKCKHFFFRTLE